MHSGYIWLIIALLLAASYLPARAAPLQVSQHQALCHQSVSRLQRDDLVMSFAIYLRRQLLTTTFCTLLLSQPEFGYYTVRFTV
jgi:hypothetical protein